MTFDCVLDDLTTTIAKPTLDKQGFSFHANLVDESVVVHILAGIERVRAAASERKRGAGVFAMRHLLKEVPEVRALTESSALLSLVAPVLGAHAFPVRAVLIDIDPDQDWYIAWHQDLNIAVKKRIETPGFGPWSVKSGILHVQPGAEILSRMVAVRLHIDDCPSDNGALRVIPESHTAGVVSEKRIAEWSSTTSEIVLPAKRGDAILMRPLLLHSSVPAHEAGYHRIIQFEFAAELLPGDLEWAIA